MNKPYDDKDWLYEEYIVKDRTMVDIAEGFGVSITPIRSRLKKFGIVKPQKPSDNNTYVELTCTNCRSKFKRKLRWVKRREREGSTRPYCTHECLYEFQRGKANPNKARKREANGYWKGGISTVNENLRDCLSEWKRDSMKYHNYTCFITGRRGGDLTVHHITPFHKIRDNCLEELNITGTKEMSRYNQEDIDKLKDLIKEKHEYEKGIVLDTKLHSKFHYIYGYGTSMSDLEEFKERYLKGEFDDLKHAI